MQSCLAQPIALSPSMGPREGSRRCSSSSPTPLAPLATPALLIASLALIAMVCEGYMLPDEDTFHVERRGYRDADDPRNLFAAMYGGNYKRSGAQAMPPAEPWQPRGLRKRGLRDRDDPRNLFREMYGGVWRR